MAILTLATCTVATSAQATPEATELKQGAAFTTSALAGAALGGPVGMILGALGGAYIGEQIKQADEVDTMTQSVAVANEEIERLNAQLVQAREETEKLQQMALESLNTQVLFHTASDQLTERGRDRVERVARLMQQWPQWRIRLDGHADPRGTDEYNNVLSQYRAKAVEEALVAAGVKPERVELYSHGSSRSRADKGDHRAYAAERRVDIDILSGRRKPEVVMN
jgi:outer membrane protein OmpA-like peptidoglycan-associated protein